MLTKEYLAKQLKAALEEKNMTQAKLAELVDSTPAKISSYVRGNTFPPVDKLAEIAKVLDVSLDKLCGMEIAKSTKGNYTDNLTLGDIARTIITMSEVVEGCECGTFSELIYEGVDFEGDPITKELIRTMIVLKYGHLSKFVTEWLKVKETCNGIEMGDKLYEPWLQSRLSRLDQLSANHSCIDDLLNLPDGVPDDGELPF